MKVGSFTIEILSEGRFEFFRDGHINRAKRAQPKSSFPDGTGPNNLIASGINPVLVQTGKQNILLDTGLGWGLDAGSPNTNVSNVRTNLRIFGLTPEDITHVVLSHLHYDHAAGASFTDDTSTVQPTFPNATYYIHQTEWDYALQQIEGEQIPFSERYRLDDLYKLVSQEQVTFLSNDATKLLDGITLIKTGGHTPGHLTVEIESKSNKAYYLGDLLPTEFQLNNYEMEAADVYPLEAKKEKVQLIKQAYQETALLLFYHSKNGQAGKLLKDEDQKYVLAKQIPLQ